MKSLPLPIRLAAGLAATVVERASKLPEEIAGLPVTMASQALQLSMRVQQRVTELAIKGDEALAGLRPVEEQPDWATFDEDDVDGGTNATVHDFLRRERPADTADDEDLVTGRPAADQPSAESTRAETTRRDSTHRTSTQGDTTRTEPDQAATEADASPEADDRSAAPEVESIEPDLRLRTPSRPRPVRLRQQVKRGGDTSARDETPEPDVTPAPDEITHAEPEQATGASAPAGLAGYDEMSVAQVRGKLRALSLDQLDELLDYERAHGARERFVTMLSNRMRTVRAADH